MLAGNSGAVDIDFSVELEEDDDRAIGKLDEGNEVAAVDVDEDPVDNFVDEDTLEGESCEPICSRSRSPSA